MKRIVTICLVALLLTTNYAYATLSIEEISPTIKAALNEKQIQQQVEELFAEIIMSIVEGEGIEGISLKELSTGTLESAAIRPNQELTGNPITDILLLLVYGVSYILQLALAGVNGIVYAFTLIVQTLLSIVLNFPQFLVNLITFTADFLIALSTFVINLILAGIDISADLLYYLIPLIISLILFIIDDIDIVT